MPDEAQQTRGHRSGFVSILGRPNAGKSTLLNALTGQKLAIVSDKPQTTRTLIQGVLTLPAAQVVFVDTPGIHAPDTTFNRKMMADVRAALEERDALLLVADASVPFTEEDRRAAALLAGAKTPALLLLNKIDRLRDKKALLPLIERYRTVHDFAEYLPVSARTGEGLDTVRAEILARLPEGPAYFPAEHITDQPERYLAAELIREQILEATRNEVPHAVAVLVDHWEEAGQLTRIAATIFVEREGQKGILIGTRGAMLKQVGTLARREIEALLDRKVFLELYVKVRPRWREDLRFLEELDWRSMVGHDHTENGL